LRNLSVRSPSYVASKRSGGKVSHPPQAEETIRSNSDIANVEQYETAYDVGEAVTRRNERDWTGRVFKTYYICCIKFDKKLKEIVYRIKPTKNSKDGTWISEKNIKKL